MFSNMQLLTITLLYHYYRKRENRITRTQHQQNKRTLRELYIKEQNPTLNGQVKTAPLQLLIDSIVSIL